MSKLFPEGCEVEAKVEMSNGFSSAMAIKKGDRGVVIKAEEATPDVRTVKWYATASRPEQVSGGVLICDLILVVTTTTTSATGALNDALPA